MAMPKINSAQLGDLFTLIYDYEKPGDILPMHNHTEDTAHIIIVAKGSVVVLVYDPENGSIDSQHLEAGALVDTFAGFPHCIIGITPESRTIHITKKLVASQKTVAPDDPRIVNIRKEPGMR
jgi:quercetin dioxygenase-like cupin family protein